MAPYSPLRQRRRTSLWRRLRYGLSRLGGTRLQKSQRVYVVSAGEHRFKRIVLRDSYLAAGIEATLERFGPSDRIPVCEARYENELWVGFIEGTPVERADDAAVRQLAGLYAEIHAREPRRVPVAESGCERRLVRDLHFLHRVGVLDGATHAGLEEALGRIVPESVWIGFDFTDPVLKNFVVAADDGRLCAVDVESLEDGQLIGTGVAKALMRWMEPWRKVFFEEYADRSPIDFGPYGPFVELCFLGAYTKLMFLEKKWKNVRPELFGRFREA